MSLGTALAIIFGVLIGLLTGSRRLTDSLLGPLLVILMLTPSLLIVFLSVFTFGFLDYVPSIAAAIVHIPFSAVVIRGQLLNPPKDKLEMAQVYGAGTGLIVRHIYIPYLVPAITSET
ncbi:MAG: ABC transporter permease subunit, partial [Candidatus Caldarchaeum sp.]|nr:ABC transporter permease subunit [Candidatus Caldarchaeum sp.]